MCVRPSNGDGGGEAIIAILEEVASEGTYTAIDRPWSVGEQRRYLTSLSSREAVHLAAHVGQLGTFLKPEWRHRGIGETLFRTTADFARERDYRKFVIQVRACNTLGQEYYRRLGFRECGRLARQVRIGEQEEDELIMEFFL